jgi:hypothetical protein
MKVGVLTFHRCINYGSYWQARCLVEGLRARGHEALLLDHDSASVRRAELRCALSPTLPSRTRRADLSRYAAKVRRFECAFERLPRTRRFPLERPEAAGEHDAVLVGSDEVWNFRHPWYGSRPIFFGEGLKAKRLSAYAASFGNHDARDGIHPDWAGRLRAFGAVSVRDENSRALLARATGAEPSVVLDPCLQFPPLPADPVEARRPYVAIYGHSFPEWFVRKVRDWARRAGRRLVSIGYRNEWADEQRIEAGPEDFRRLIAGAKAVVTNFFHGCVFALLSDKPFACVPSDYRRNKVADLTGRLGLEGSLVTPSTSDLGYTSLLERPPGERAASRLASARRESERFLASALE